MLSMLDLFSGSGAASRAAEVRGWRVLRIDNAIDSNADLKMDLSKWFPWESESYPMTQWDLIWASPPCDLLTTARTKGRNVTKGLELVERSIEIIRELKPRWWVLENVHGATRAIARLLGPPVERYGSFYLWGCFPPFEAGVERNKKKLSGRRRAERRARIPWAISNGLIKACEQIDREIGATSDAARTAEGAGLGQPRGNLGASSAAGGGPEETQRRINYLNERGIYRNADGEWYGSVARNESFVPTWKRLMSYEGLPENWNPPRYYENLDCNLCSRKHGKNAGGELL